MSATDGDIHPGTITPRGIMIMLVASLAGASYSFTWNSVGVALPHMKGAFSATTDQVAWIMIAYIVGSATSTASVGWFVGRFGRRKVFLSAIAGFTLTQIGCGLSTTLEAEVAWRFVQGIMGAPLIPISQVIAVNAFPRDRYTQATSMWAMGFILSNVLAPTIAGYVVDAFSWNWVFFVTIPVSTSCLIAGYFLVPDSSHDRRPMDWFGFLFLILGIGCLQLMIARGERLGWFHSTEIVIEFIAAALLLYLFVVHTVFARRPFIDRSLFRDWNFVLGQICVFGVGMSMFLPLLLIPLQLQQLGGYPASEIGLLIAGRGVGAVISLIFISCLADHLEQRMLMAFGLFITAVGPFILSDFTADVRGFDVILANFIMGVAVGSAWAPMSKLSLSHLPKRTQDQGFAVFYLMFDIGYAIGAALIVALLTQHSQIGHALFAEHISSFSAALLDDSAVRAGWDITTTKGLSVIDNEVARQAAAVAFNNCYLVIAIILVAIIPLLIFFRKDQSIHQDLVVSDGRSLKHEHSPEQRTE